MKTKNNKTPQQKPLTRGEILALIALKQYKESKNQQAKFDE